MLDPCDVRGNTKMVKKVYLARPRCRDKQDPRSCEHGGQEGLTKWLVQGAAEGTSLARTWIYYVLAAKTRDMSETGL